MSAAEDALKEVERRLDDDDHNWWSPAYSLPSLLAEFFEINMDKVDAEQREILRQLREEQQ